MGNVLCSFSVSPHAIFVITPDIFCFALHLLTCLIHVLGQSVYIFYGHYVKNIFNKHPQTINKSYVSCKCSYFTIIHPLFLSSFALSSFRKLGFQPRDLCLRLPPKYIILFLVYFTQRVN